MYCMNCSQEVDANADYCMNCGKPPLEGNNYCYNCNLGMRGDEKFCPSCGTDLVYINVSENHTQAEQSSYCRSCGNSVNPDTNFCRDCGKRPLDGQDFCQNCGVETAEGQEVCTSCGVRLKNTYDYDTNFNQTGSRSRTIASGLGDYWDEEFSKIRESGETYKGKWNWPAFFFTWIWALTKGMWAVAVITLLVNFIFAETFVIPFIASIFLGVRGNYIHYRLIEYGEQIPKDS